MVAVANNNTVKDLALVAVAAIVDLARPHSPPSLPLHLHANNLGPESHQPMKIVISREILKVAEDLTVPRKATAIMSTVVGDGNEGVIGKTHAFPREIGAKRIVEAGMDHPSIWIEAKRIGFDCGDVDPGPANAVTALENDDAVALTPELPRGYETGGAGTDDGDAAAEH